MKTEITTSTEQDHTLCEGEMNFEEWRKTYPDYSESGHWTISDLEEAWDAAIARCIDICLARAQYHKESSTAKQGSDSYTILRNYAHEAEACAITIREALCDTN